MGVVKGMLKKTRAAAASSAMKRKSPAGAKIKQQRDSKTSNSKFVKGTSAASKINGARKSSSAGGGKSKKFGDDAAADLMVDEKQKKREEKRLKYAGYRGKKEEEELSDFEEVPAAQENIIDVNHTNKPVEEEDNDDELESDIDFESSGKEMMRQVLEVNKKAAKSTGGFESMGLTLPIFKAIKHKGYRIPTPIQRKSIPIIMEGKDVVAMARTGSGKTAAFIIPLLEKLKVHSAKVGARGIILSPSRELALQTLKFVKELAKYTDIRACMLVGGESMEEQFNTIASNPDIIIATPGRLMHLIVEMNLNLKTVEYIVFDEADRLFELGFAEHLREILFKLPESRQTLLFSATLPKNLVDFARAGLSEPELIRLDVDTKISKDLELLFMSVKTEDKEAALLYVLRKICKVETTSTKALTIIFAPTKHHVDYLFELLTTAGIDCTYIYGSLDQSARKIHLARFRAASVKILIVTDVAARGIDVPLLDYVINYEFPGAPKVFVHRVGRAARAGRRGTAISLVTSDELPYLIDLQLFLGRPLLLGSAFEKQKEGDVATSVAADPSYTTEVVFGTIPPSMLDADVEFVRKAVHENASLTAMLEASKNAFKLYVKTRGSAARESYLRSKEILGSFIGLHPIIAKFGGSGEVDRQDLLRSISQFRPAETVFEVGKRGVRSKEASLMIKRRSDLGGVIEASKHDKNALHSDMMKKQIESINSHSASKKATWASEEDLNDTFNTVISDSKKRKRQDTDYKDSEYYMSHYKQDEATERGYSMTTKPVTFAEQVKSATMDLHGDDSSSMMKGRTKMLWDSKKHKFVRPTVGQDNKKMIKTESGAVIAGSYKSERYQEWQKKTKVSIPRAGDQELPNAASYTGNGAMKRYRHTKMLAADPNSKNSQRRAMRMEKEAKEAKRNGTSVSSSSMDKQGSSGGGNKVDMVKIKKGAKTKLVKHMTVGKHGGKPELKGTMQIAKERRMKEKRREKTGRHFKK